MAEQTPQLDNPKILIVYKDGREATVQTENPDMVFFDLERARRKWPTFQDAPMLWVNYLAYSKLKRTGEIAGDSFDAWLLTTQAIKNLNADDQESGQLLAVGPTQPTPGPT